MNIGPRSAITTTGPSRPGNGTSQSWAREINGTMHTFTAVTMPDGERRYFVSRFNGYAGGPAFACAWTRTHAITVPAAPVVEPAPCAGQAGWPGCEDCGHGAPAYHGTKYSSPAAEVIAILSSVSEGYGAEETGDCESPAGFIALVILDETCDLAFDDFTNYPRGDYAGEVARTYGVSATDVMGAHIVTTGSQGFVTVETFDTADIAREQYACRAAWFAEWDDEDRDEDGDGIYVCPVIGHGYHTL